MFEKIKEYEEELLQNVTPVTTQEVNLSNDEINDKYLKGDVRIVTEQARYPLNQIKNMFDGDSYERHPVFQ